MTCETQSAKFEGYSRGAPTVEAKNETLGKRGSWGDEMKVWDKPYFVCRCEMMKVMPIKPTYLTLQVLPRPPPRRAQQNERGGLHHVKLSQRGARPTPSMYYAGGKELYLVDGKKGKRRVDDREIERKKSAGCGEELVEHVFGSPPMPVSSPRSLPSGLPLYDYAIGNAALQGNEGHVPLGRKTVGTAFRCRLVTPDFSARAFDISVAQPYHRSLVN
ncbi:hypothetical protein R3P38DRAFT_2799382 [Favolaschia claudopus]|uniref:Uncharacterized protein n=1 Tax=Favolaschia claudopus TaxID=2862362 RepID=A0AAW0A0R0_9AGAR